MTEEQIKQMAEKELVAYLKGCAFSLCPASKKYMAEHIEELLKQAEATKELQEELKVEKGYSATLRKEIDEYTNSHTLCAKYKELEKQLNEAKIIIRGLLKYIFTPEGFEELDKDMIMKAKAFLKE